MPYTKEKCKTCGSTALKERVNFGTAVILSFKCGHAQQEELIEATSEIYSEPSSDGKNLYPFQSQTVSWALKSNVRCLVAHEMGLGKTPISIVTAMSRKEKLLPMVVLCKSSVKLQWFKELLRWSKRHLIPQVISNSNEEMVPGFDVYIFSLDLLRRFNGLEQKFKECGIKFVVIDECQLIKNHQSQRTEAVQQLCAATEHIMGLSGTPIKNRAPEYFSILNILRPDMFPVYEKFVWYECNTYNDRSGRGKVGGLRRPTEFKEKTKEFVIRFEREEVMPELPVVSRNYRYAELSKVVENAYNKELEGFTNEYDSLSDDERGSFGGMSNVLAYIARMRHIVGVAKIDATVDYVAEFLGSNERKLSIFVHHKDVHQLLLNKLDGLCKDLGIKPPLSLTSDLNSDKRNALVELFQTDPTERLVIASTLAFGEGLNLQACSDCIMMERQWNPANEEQAEARFIRIGQKADKVTATYMVATGTIDEYFAEIVEKKREIFNQTMGSDKSAPWEESSIMKELTQRLVVEGRKRWEIK